MSVRTIDTSQIRTLGEHLAIAANLDSSLVADLEALASQLHGVRVLPIVGAGASHDCGMRLAAQIGQDLYEAYHRDSAYAPHQTTTADLADVAQAIYNEAGQVRVVHELGLPDKTRWPAAEDIDDHFCTYRVLARLAREEFFEEVVGFNYDCGKEAGLLREGFLTSPDTTAGGQWRDHATTVADKVTFHDVRRPGVLTYLKAHGCAERFRVLAHDNEAAAAETIIVRKDQLTNWRQDTWLRDHLYDRLRTHVVLLLGFSGQDGVIHGALKTILDEVYQAVPANGTPRVVAVDWDPNTATLRGLVKSGLGGQEPQDGMVSSVNVSSGTTTAAALVLLSAVLRLRLRQHFDDCGEPLPSGPDAQLATFVVAAPIMLRWTYLLRPAVANQFIQKINVEQAASGGYVPLTVDPTATLRTIATRRKLRMSIGATGEEGAHEAMKNHGFIVRSGFAFLPVAMDLADLNAACRPGGPITRARATLKHPNHLECVLVTDTPSGLRAVNIDTGSEVPL